MTFRLGLVGAGRMGQTHLRAYADFTDVAVTAIVEPVAELREDVSRRFALTPYESLDSFLEGAEVDGVLIVTPSDSHADVISRVAAAGLPMLCEKPCGVSVAETTRAADVVSAAGVALQVAYWRRFVPSLQAIRERIGAGEFGDVLSLSCLQWDGAPPTSAFRARSGGILIDMGVHEFDQARWLTGADFGALSAMNSPVITDENVDNDPDSVQVLATMSNGTTTLVSLGRHYAGGDMASVEVFGTRGHQLELFLDPAAGEATQLDALRRQASAFARYVETGVCEGATINDAIATLAAAATATQQIPLLRR